MLVECHSSVGSVPDLRTEGRMFDPRLGQYSFIGLIIVIGFDNGYIGKQTVVWKKYIVRNSAEKNPRKA